MTVIVWDGTSLAADRQSSVGDMRTAVSKIVRREDGALVALCGSQSLGLAMIDSIFGEAAWPTATTDEGATIIVVKPGEPAIFYSSERKIAMPVEQGWMTWGSGREFAAGALLMGADAKRAVEITNQLCNGCGLGVTFRATHEPLNSSAKSRSAAQAGQVGSATSRPAMSCSLAQKSNQLSSAQRAQSQAR